MLHKCVRGGLAVLAVLSTGVGMAIGCSSSSQPVTVGDMPGFEASTSDVTMGDDGPSIQDSSKADADGASPAEGGVCADSGKAGEVLCNNVCTDLQTDTNNCGTCGHGCGDMGVLASCSAGTCVCTADSGSLLCGNLCADLQTDTNNCGACGHQCQVYGTNMCASGRCQPVTVATPGGPIWDIAIGATAVYFTQPSQGSTAGKVQRAPLGANEQVAPVATWTYHDPRGIALDSTRVFWVDYADTSVDQVASLGGTVVVDWPIAADAGVLQEAGAAPEAGEAPEAGGANEGGSDEAGAVDAQAADVAAAETGGTGGGIPTYAQPFDVAVDGTFVYWVASGAGAVLRVAVGNTSSLPQVLASGQDGPVAIAVDATNVYWANQGSGNGGSILQTKKDGSGSVIVLATNEPSPWDIAVDAKNVYWTDQVNPGFVKQVPIGGPSSSVITLASNEGAPYGITVDATHVYYTTYAGGTVTAVPIGGGAKTVYATQQTNPGAIAVQNNFLYWVNNGTNATILAVPK